MKSYNGFFEQMTDPEEVAFAIREAAKHKTRRRVVQDILEHQEERAALLAEKLREDRWKPPHHQIHVIQEGPTRKRREIQKPRFDDEQIVHHLLGRQLRKIIEPRLYRYAYGSLPGRGPHEAARVMRRWRDEYGGKRFYVLEADVRHCYDEIDVEVLKEKLRSRIRDRRFLRVNELVIDVGSPGLPKGFYTSPWYLSLYMETFDNFVVQTLRPDHYLRYVDNIFVLHRNKRQLHRMQKQIAAYLRTRLHIRLRDDWQVFRFGGYDRETGRSKGRAINALGFVIHPDRVSIRKSTIKGARAKARHIHKRHRYTAHDSASMLSRMGPFQHADAYRYFQTYIKPMVSLRYCRRRVAARARKDRIEYERLAHCQRQPDGTACGAG